MNIEAFNQFLPATWAGIIRIVRFWVQKIWHVHKLEKIILHLQLKLSFKYFRFTHQSRMNMIQFTELVARMTL